MADKQISQFLHEDFADVDMDDVDQDADYELQEQSPVSEEHDYTDDVHLFRGGGSRRKPHHYTVCFFPIASLLPAEIDRFALYEPDDHLDRFRPLPPPLSVGAGIYTETRFYTITPVRSLSSIKPSSNDRRIIDRKPWSRPWTEFLSSAGRRF